jgi:hypothetical protein
MRSRSGTGWVLATALVVPIVSSPIVSSAPAAAAAVPIRGAREVRTTWTSEFGVERPDAVTYMAAGDELLVSETSASGTEVVRLDFDERATGSVRLPALSDSSSLAYDPVSDELTAVDDGDVIAASGDEVARARPRVRRSDAGALNVDDVAGSTFDPGTGTWYVLNASGRELVRVADRKGRAATTRVSLDDLPDGTLRGLALNPADGLLYVGRPEADALHAVDTNGTLRATYDLADVDLRNPGAMTFAPSSDTSDEADRQNLFVTQAGDAEQLGGVTEVTLLAAAAVTATNVDATLVQTIDTSRFSPASPDPSGIAYLPGPDRLHIVDSEVEEVTGAGYHGVNMWQFTRSGVLTDTGTTYPAYSKEPTGTAYDPGSNTLFISDDSAGRIHVVKPGTDGRFGNADDVRTFVPAAAYGSGDTEDPAFDTRAGVLYFSDAISTEVYRVDPVNGVFGDGNDTVIHFDVGRFGPDDGEGLAYHAVNDTLLVGDRNSKEIYEITKDGSSLVRVIDADVGDYDVLSGLTVAPAVNDPTRLDLWIVSRGVDNGANSRENDGKVIEVSVGGSGPVDTPPVVTVSSPADGATVSGSSVPVQASASDDVGVTRVQFFDGATSIGTDTNGADGWSINWNTTTVPNGSHTLRATATDTIGQTGTDTNTVTVANNVDTPPVASMTNPADGATVSGSAVAVQASASDDVGVTRVQFFDGATSIGTDTDGTNGWSVNWNTTTGADGAHVIRATATDTAGQTGTDTNSVTVDNSPPTASVTSPVAGSTVTGNTTVVANANDPQGLTSVAFFVDGTTLLGTDVNGADGWSVSWNTVGTTNGPHSLTARAVNRAGAATTSAAVPVTVSNSGATLVLDIPIATGRDDIEERASDGRIDIGSTDLDILLDNAVPQSAVGLRFIGVGIPRGAVITNAYVQFKADETWSDPTSITINGFAADNLAIFPTKKFSLGQAARTAASVQWSPVGWIERRQGVEQQTSNLSAVVQEVVNRPGWTPGNALGFVLTGSGRRVAKAFEAGAPPILHIEYTTG